MRLLLLSVALLANAAAETAPFSSNSLRALDAAVRLGMHERDFPGGVLRMQHGERVYLKAYGNRMVDPRSVPNKESTLYDAASLTKVIATTPAVML